MFKIILIPVFADVVLNVSIQRLRIHCSRCGLMRHLSMNVVWKTITAINLGQHGLGSSSSVFLMPLGAHTLFCFKGTEFLWLLMFFVSSHTGCLWLLMFFLRLTQDAFGSSCFCLESHNRMPLAPHVFVSTHRTGCFWSSHNRMPLAPHVFVSTHRTGCPWLLTEQDAFGSSCAARALRLSCNCVGAVSKCLLLQ